MSCAALKVWTPLPAVIERLTTGDLMTTPQNGLENPKLDLRQRVRAKLMRLLSGAEGMIANVKLGPDPRGFALSSGVVRIVRAGPVGSPQRAASKQIQHLGGNVAPLWWAPSTQKEPCGRSLHDLLIILADHTEIEDIAGNVRWKVRSSRSPSLGSCER